MDARDIMSAPVLAAGPQTPVLQIAALLREKRIGGVPVLAGHEIVGIVTEKDLLHRQELGTERRNTAHAWWRRMVEPGREPEWYVKSHGRCARHVMTRRVIVATPETPLIEITHLFERHRIGRVPVVRDGRLVGIVATADLVKALSLGNWVSRRSAAGGSDEAIRAALVAELAAQSWWNGGISAVDVSSGVVRFTGFFESDAQRRASQVAAENISGVQEVRDERQDISELPTIF